eukprot:CAMPEP_0184533014 /NCGR_PEP_ID=MMETSP0198_2-20121128/14503_1 /TAXON_ID=1112570 /ORGANISM="Thraustochytrium sp., Strain LLF1b" /LENGTH=79 /DNA_ID=CAMNT_0026925707 /DNA_START=51 /DNA_END=287 /DNA_ORIENTATION=+
METTRRSEGDESNEHLSGLFFPNYSNEVKAEGEHTAQDYTDEGAKDLQGLEAKRHVSVKTGENSGESSAKAGILSEQAL